MRRYLVFFVVSLGLFLASLSGTTVSVAFPVITTDFNVSVLVAGWLLSAFNLVSVSATPLAAKLSDNFGRKSTFMLCIFLFTLGSVLCAIAPNINWLIFFRVIQGLGGGGIMPAAAGIVSDEFPKSRQRAIGLFSSIFPAGSIIGPNVGGWMVESYGWQSIFWLNLPLGLTILIMGLFLLSPGRPSSQSRGIDLTGTVLLTVFLTSFMVAATEAGNGGARVPWALLGFFVAAGIVSLIFFIRQEKRTPDPLINLELLQKRPFLGANVYNLIYGASAFGVFSLVPLYAVSAYGMSVFTSGIILTPRSGGMMIASAVMSFLLIRFGYRRPIIIGTLGVVLSLTLLALQLHSVNILGISLSVSVLLLSIMALSGTAMGVATPAANNACIELMPDKIATITGLRGMFRQIGGAVGITIATIILENVADAQRAFFIIFIGFGALLLISLPSVFLMPSGPRSIPQIKKAPILSPQPDK